MPIIVGTACDLDVDSSALCEFYDKNWKRRIALMEPAFHNWQFKYAPDCNSMNNCIVALDGDTREVAGVMGLTPRAFNMNGSQTKGAELTTWVVSEKFRGSGAGAKILSYTMESYDVLIGMGISNMALPIYVRSGFRYLHAIPRFVRVRNFGAIEKIATFDKLAKKIGHTNIGNRKQAEYVASSVLPQDAEHITNKARDRLNFFNRDARNLQWRYTDHPSFKYELFSITDKQSDSSALVVVRREESVPGIRICHVLDVIGEEQAMHAAFAFIDDFCEEQNIDFADFYCTAASVNKYPLSMGWFSTLDDKYLAVPHLFHPVELRSPATTSLIYWAQNSMIDMCDFSKLYITKQDADFDRPTLEV
ncbi:hypothetical protein SAMN05421862_11584 [Pseudomonas extremaustralis]|uniref:GNAT family N-acetyltransferase n=1 Tax=Pseudomonas extremaustralis TaxID=359110 RepID=UPI00099B46E7|nr:GNAT family N-acetyltransferase [Pseudomonas extremaustralis]SKB00379.1 hypothetical protein SAMN05421862_11584 [Pseudomonas extremaustralis]